MLEIETGPIDVMLGDFVVFFEVLKHISGSLIKQKFCLLGDVLEELVALTVLTTILIKTVEIQKVMMLFFVGGAVAETLSKLLEPSAEETGHVKIAQEWMRFVSVFEKVNDAGVGKGVAGLGVGNSIIRTKADIEKRCEVTALEHHACLACTARLDHGSAAIVGLATVFGELVEIVIMLGDKVQEVNRRMAVIFATELGCKKKKKKKTLGSATSADLGRTVNEKAAWTSTSARAWCSVSKVAVWI